MKKLMMAAAIVCAAVASQASVVKWSMTNATSADKDTTVYLLNSIASSYESIEAFEATAVDSPSVIKSGPKYVVAEHVSPDNGSITDKANFYLAILDKDGDKDIVRYLDVTSAFQAKVFDPPATAPGTATALFSDLKASTTTATISGGDVPEPTSAMLLLLGVAGLALRRRA